MYTFNIALNDITIENLMEILSRWEMILASDTRNIQVKRYVLPYISVSIVDLHVAAGDCGSRKDDWKRLKTEPLA